MLLVPSSSHRWVWMDEQSRFSRRLGMSTSNKNQKNTELCSAEAFHCMLVYVVEEFSKVNVLDKNQAWWFVTRRQNFISARIHLNGSSTKRTTTKILSTIYLHQLTVREENNALSIHIFQCLIQRCLVQKLKVPSTMPWWRKRLVVIIPGWTELAVIATPSSCLRNNYQSDLHHNLFCKVWKVVSRILKHSS